MVSVAGATFVVVLEHPVFRPFGVVELAALFCPEKDEPGAEAEEKGKDDEGYGGGEHGFYRPERRVGSRATVFRRRELSTTRSELAAMAAAAHAGASLPLMASGMATRL